MRIAVYAGTFNPITRGHLSVIERVSGLFDRLIVLVAVNPEKSPLFSVSERVELIRDAVRDLGNVTADSTPDWVAHYAHSVGARWLIRGVRDTTDMASEHELALLNQKVAADVTTLFVPAQGDLTGVSSSGLKRLASEGQPLERYCTTRVAQALVARLEARREVDHGA